MVRGRMKMQEVKLDQNVFQPVNPPSFEGGTREDEQALDLRELFYLMVKNLWLIIALAIFFGAVVGFVSKFAIQPKYESSTIITIITKRETPSSDMLRVSAEMAQRFSIIAKTNKVLDQVVEIVNADEQYDLDLTVKDLKELYTVSTVNNTDFLQLTVKYTDPEIAAYLAETITEVTIEAYEEVYGSSDEVHWLDHAQINEKPVSPNVLLNTAIGFVIGGIVAVGIILFKELFNRKVRSQNDIEQLGILFLGHVPEFTRRQIR